MAIDMPASLRTAAGRGVGVRDVPLALVAPRRLFRRVEDVAAWGWPLVVLLTAVTLVGYAEVQTGLIDREVERGVRERIAVIEREQRDVVERAALREMYEQEIKKGQFEQLLARIQVVVAEPVRTLAEVLLIASVLYGAVALTGRKPEWHSLLTICVFAAFTNLLRLALSLALMLHYRTLTVLTSAEILTRYLPLPTGPGAAKTTAAVAGALSAVDPFSLWFWFIVIVGLSVTSQLPGWRAWLVCGLCWLVYAAAHAGLAVAVVASAAKMGGMGG